jgi:hypothetical protein
MVDRSKVTPSQLRTQVLEDNCRIVSVPKELSSSGFQDRRDGKMRKKRFNSTTFGITN